MMPPFRRLLGNRLAVTVPSSLLDAIEADGDRPAKKSYGPRVVAWLGNLTQKMLNGTGRLVLAAAPGLIDKALSDYYGWK